jgi:vacuolar protein sorting-associated protein 29
VQYDGKYFINPGSATGAYSSTNSSPRPSFILIAVQGDEVVAFIYELVNEEINVQRIEFTKKK